MGAAPNKIPGGEAMADGSRWVCLTAGQAGVGHSGCSLGRIDRAAGESVWRGTARRKTELYLAADTSQAALEAAASGQDVSTWLRELGLAEARRG